MKRRKKGKIAKGKESNQYIYVIQPVMRKNVLIKRNGKESTQFRKEIKVL